MRQNIVLIDFENVQPENLSALAHDHFRVFVFVGANQKKVSVQTAASVQKLGSRAEYVMIAGNGSKDAGFDPLIAHLKSKKILAGRVKGVEDIPLVKSATAKTPEDRIEAVIQKLSSPKATKPRTVKTLSSHIASFYQKQLPDEEIRTIIEGLTSAGFISIDGTKITYAPMSG